MDGQGCTGMKKFPGLAIFYIRLTDGKIKANCFSIWIEIIEKILHVNLCEPYIKMFYFLDFER